LLIEPRERRAVQSQNKKENNENLEQKINEKTVRKIRFMGLSKKSNDLKTRGS